MCEVSVHPRTRGEHRRFAAHIAPIAGSSPHARGTLCAELDHQAEHRFIPARAGNTLPSYPAITLASVHPRTRGEHLTIPRPCRSRIGSSPHARGTPRQEHRQDKLARFIPARAGNTLTQKDRNVFDAVHPRTRGEHLANARILPYKGGSSPHARGTRTNFSIRGIGQRFIPARAGNTMRAPVQEPPAAVHPRTRGEHDGVRQLVEEHLGSSPHARGTQELEAKLQELGRFIPARAGNTLWRHLRRLDRPVHPRTRGEHSSWKWLITKRFLEVVFRTD